MVQRYKLILLFSILLFFITSCNIFNNPNDSDSNSSRCKFKLLNTVEMSFDGDINCANFAKMVIENLKYCSCNSNRFFYEKSFWDAVEDNKECLDDYANSNILKFFSSSESMQYFFYLSKKCKRTDSGYDVSFVIDIEPDSVKITKRHIDKWYIDN